MTPEVEDDERGGVDVDLVGDIMRRHGSSKQPESRRVCAFLQAIVAALAQEGVEPKPTAVFAAVVLALEGTQKVDEGRNAVADQTAALYLLAQAMSKMARAAVSMKATRGIAIVTDILRSRSKDEQPNAQVLKNAVGCLSDLVCCHDTKRFATVAPSFATLVKYSTDPKPKVRKRACAGLSEAFASFQGSPALLTASEQISRFVEQTVGALLALVSEGGGRGKAAQQRLQTALTLTFHVLGALKGVIRDMDVKESLKVLGAIQQLSKLNEPLLIQHASVVVDRFFQSPKVVAELQPSLISDLISGLTQELLVMEDLMADAETATSTLGMFASAFRALDALDKRMALACLPPLLHQCLHYFRRKDSEAFRVKVGRVLGDLMALCFSEALVAEAHAALAKGKKKAKASHPVLRVVAAVEAMLTVPYQSCWDVALSFVGRIARLVGEEHAAVVASCVREVGVLGSGVEHEWTAAIQECVGECIRALGPRAVLAAIPLGIVEAIDCGTEANAWLVYVLKKNVSGASLAFWGEHMLGLARQVGTKAAELKAGKDVERAVLVAALEHQLWQTLPAFCRWSSDTREGFHAIAQPLGLAMQNREDLRKYVCNALVCLIKQNLSIVQEAEGGADGKGEGADDGESVSLEEDGFDFDIGFEVPASYTTEAARANLSTVAEYAKNFLPLLFNLFVAAPPNHRGPLHAAIAAFAHISDADILDGFYKNILKRMAQALQEEGTDKSKSVVAREQQEILMDIACALTPGLKPPALGNLVNITKVSIRNPNPGIQKKGYKLLQALLKRAGDLGSECLLQVHGTLLEAQGACTAPAKRHRLHCMRALIRSLDGGAAFSTGIKDRDEEALTAMVTEMVMCTKEKNSKTHKAALDLLADIASSFEGLRFASEGPLLAPGPAGFVNVVAGGLVASHPHMISATVIALTRLVFQFSHQLGPDVVSDVQKATSSLLRTKSREVVKSVLGFLSMYVGLLDGATLHAELPALVESLLIWANDSKNRFRLKIRHILEKCIRQLGLDEVSRHIPEQHQPIIRYMRKQGAREKRRRDGSVASWGAGTRRTAGGRTAWTEEDGASMEEGSDGGGSGGRAPRMGRASTHGDGRSDARTARATRKRVRFDGAGMNGAGEPTDLLNSQAMIALSGGGAGRGGGGSDDEGALELKTARDGRLIVPKNIDKYERRDVGVSGEGGPGDEDARSRRSARTQNRAASSRGGGSRGGVSAQRPRAASTTGARSRVLGGSRFKSKGGAGGDVKGKGRVEPFAYWPLDRKMLNRRAAKRRSATAELRGVTARTPNKKRRQD